MRRIVPVVGLLALVPGLYVRGASRRPDRAGPARGGEADHRGERHRRSAGLKCSSTARPGGSMEVFGPDGRKLLDVESRGELGPWG